MRRGRKPCQSSLFRGRDASLLVVSRPSGQKWRRTEAACDEAGEAVRASCRAFQPPRRGGGAPMLNTAIVVPEEQRFILSTMPPGPTQKRLALALVLALLVAFFIVAGPLSTI